MAGWQQRWLLVVFLKFFLKYIGSLECSRHQCPLLKSRFTVECMLTCDIPMAYSNGRLWPRPAEARLDVAREGSKLGSRDRHVNIKKEYGWTFRNAENKGFSMGLNIKWKR